MTKKLNLLVLTVLIILSFSACGGGSADAVTARVAPDGSGDYESLEAAVEAVPAGSTINLDPGVYRLDQALTIDKSLHLVGAGMDETEIVSEAEGYVLRFNGGRSFSAEGITFRHEGELEADVVVVQTGEVEFTDCRFTGSVYVVGVAVHAGLRFQGRVSGTVRDCVAEENGSTGILVEKGADPLLEGNLCTNNSSAGIAYYNTGGGQARDNECNQNDETGILVAGEAQPVLEENVCRENQAYGIAYAQQGAGEARGNECTANAKSGIYVGEEAQPTLVENVCTENAESGIAYLDNAGGVARENECSMNQGGIGLGGNAQPTLERNICRDNEVAGITFSAESGGVARENECTGNDVGILVVRTANPELEDNNSYDNAEEDIVDMRY